MNEFYWMFAANEFIPEYREVRDGISVSIMKVGGGTLGEIYAGAWLVRVVGAPCDDDFQCETGLPKTHAEVAEEVFSEMD